MNITTEQQIALLSLPGIGRKTAFNIIEKIHLKSIVDNETFTDYLFEIREDLKFKKLSIATIGDFEKGFHQANLVLDKSEQNDVKVISYFDKEFPESLKTIANPPMIISFLGDYKALKDKTGIAIIGTRDPTSNGYKIGNYIGKAAAEQGFNIVSGLAKGCDTAAHEGCLLANGFTTAIVAHGLHMVYPKENRQLAAEIIDKGGCIISEYLWGVKPMNNFFVERDRLQSGLSQGTIVIQTDIKGGTMHAVNATLESGKRLGAVQFSGKELQSSKTNGNEYLISSKNAFPITKSSLDEFLNNLKKIVSEITDENTETGQTSFNF